MSSQSTFVHIYTTLLTSPGHVIGIVLGIAVALVTCTALALITLFQFIIQHTVSAEIAIVVRTRCLVLEGVYWRRVTHIATGSIDAGLV